MIIDLQKFVAEEKPAWKELEQLITRQEREPLAKLTLAEVKRFHYLYQRASSDLAKLTTFSADRGLQQYLEGLVSRAYCEIHETRSHHRFRPLHWLLVIFPCAFRRHLGAFWLALAVTLAGGLFGAVALTIDNQAKNVIMPRWAPHLRGDPAERVRREEATESYHGLGATGTAFYFTHNTKVAIGAMALGFTWGIGTIVMLFYNGVILGAVLLDYAVAGQGVFVTAWLLPHGAVEIPAILVAGQAGLVLAGAVIGWGKREALFQRLRRVGKDVVTLIFGVAVLLLWAGVVESWFSQMHEPVIPYGIKIIIGCLQLLLVVLLLAKSGSGYSEEEKEAPGDHP